MKKNMSHMTGASLGLSFDPAPASGGGGAAVATPPAAPAAPSPAPAAPSAPPASSSGFFRGMPKSTVQAPPEPPNPASGAAPTAPPAPPAPAAPKPGDKFQLLDDDGKTVLGTFATQEEAAAFDTKVKADRAATAGAPKPGDPPAPAPDAESLARPFLGRAEIKTLKAAEDAYRRSQEEGIRLHEENKGLKATLQKDVADRDAKLADLTAQLEAAKAVPPVLEKTKEELDKLFKEDPQAAAEYLTDRKLRERDAAAAKEQAARAVQQRTERLKTVNAEIERHDFAMRSDPKTYPKFEDMGPTMAKMLNVTMDDKGATPLRGQVWGNEALYLMALGDHYRDLLTKGVEVTADAAAAARAKAEADAAAARGPAGGSGGGNAKPAETPQEKADREYTERVLGSQPKPFLAERKT